MVELEGWAETHLLPDGWIFKVPIFPILCFLFSYFVLPPISFYNTLKVVKDGISGEFSASRTIGGKLWSSQMVFLAKEGDRLCSVAAVKEYMERSPKYNFEDLINFKAFLREDGTTPGELREQIQRSVEVAPWGLKKYKSNQKPGARLPSAQKPDKILLESVKEDEWSEDDEEDEANIPYDADSDEEAKDEKNLGRKPKNDYEPFVYEMIPTKKAKELRMDLNMLTIARRPFKLILNETIERAKEDKNADANGVASSAEIDDPRNSCWNCKIAAQEDNLCLCIGCKKVRRCGRTFNH